MTAGRADTVSDSPQPKAHSTSYPAIASRSMALRAPRDSLGMKTEIGTWIRV
jgi:hypothetical protein